MTPEQAITVAEIAGKLNQPVGRLLLNAWAKGTPDEMEIALFHADDDDLIAAVDRYWEERKAQVVGPIEADYATHDDWLAANPDAAV